MMGLGVSKRRISVVAAAVLASAWPVGLLRADTAAVGRMPLSRGGRPACAVVAVTGRPRELLMDRAADAIVGTVRRWGGIDLPVVRVDERAGKLPDGPAIVLTTLERLRKVAPEAEATVPLLLRVGFLDEQGFVLAPEKAGGGTRLFAVGRTPRGVYNAAVYLRDFGIDGGEDSLSVSLAPVVRAPRMGGRAAYTLTIWAHEAKYTVDNWATVFDSFARDGFDRVYFWVSGHFPSTKYPQAYKCVDGEWDTTKESRIGTVEDLRRIIGHAHDRGLKIYHGGALGGWCGAGMLTNGQPGTMKTGTGIASRSLCPSSPVSRKALIEYYTEIFDALPEADGLFIESADEWGECQCADCRKPVDEFGSRQFGQAQLTLVQEIMRSVWRNLPHVRLSYTIGYGEHKKDPAYYEVVRQMSDPRIEWMEARDSWAFAGPGGGELPAAHFSRQVMRWRQYYNLTLDDLVKDANRAAASGWYGLITAFEPGAGTGDIYRDIPYPTDILPYALTGFAWREMTWEPTLTAEALRERVQARFFGREAPAQLGLDLWELREIIRACAGSARAKPALRTKLDGIGQRIEEARAAASPKTAEAMSLMTRAIADVRRHLEQKKP